MATSMNAAAGGDLTEADQATLAYVRSPQAIRDRCQFLFDLACADQLTHFRVHLDRLDAVADYVLAVMQRAYPTLDVPFHSRWRHFEVGTTPRLQTLATHLANLSPLQRAMAESDLAIVSVLLDAGAGPDWRYVEPGSGEVFQRSEGLAVASFHLFCQGVFSSDPASPYQVDAIALQRLTETTLATGLQVSADNPLVGLPGRVQLLQQLGYGLHQYPVLFTEATGGWPLRRPGAMVQALLASSDAGLLSATTVLHFVLVGLGDIWPGRLDLAGVNLGDVWPHSALAGLEPPWVPFHKLSQWLTYSLLEPLQTLGLTITDLDQLTGLPEYRNGGLCLDLGLLELKHPSHAHHAHAPSSELIVEWRALTVILLDRIAQRLRQQLHLSAEQLPLVKILQGGTWTAGRQIAQTLRPGGPPPITLLSDGTVF
jgi:hypothetical protein